MLELELQNYCRHERLLVTPPPGVVGIVGPNGSGKSTILAALRLAILGASGNAGVKEDDVRADAPGKTPSFVRAVLEAEAGTVEVVRQLRGGKSRLSRDGKVVARGESAVGEALADWLGMDPAFFCEHAFVRQGRLTDFLDAQDAARVASLQRLFGADGAAAAFRACTDHLSSLKVEDHSAALESARDEVAEREHRIAELESELESYEDVAGYDPARDPAMMLSELQRRQRALEGRLETTRQRSSKVADRLTDAKQRLVAALAGLRDADVELAACLDAAGRVDEIRSRIRFRDEAEAQARKARKHLEQAEQRLADLEREPPELFEGYVAADDPLRDDLEAIKLSLYDCNKLLEAYDNGVAECPTCGTPVAVVAERLEEAREAQPVLKEQLRVVLESVYHDEEEAEWHAAIEAARRDVEGRREVVAGFAAQEVSDEERSELEACDAALDAARSRQAELKAEEKSRREAMKIYDKQHRELYEECLLLASQIDALDRETEALVAEAGSPDDARKRLARFERRARLAGELDAARAVLKSARCRLEDVQDAASRAAAVASHARLVRSARDLLHRDAAPAVLSARCMEAAAAETSRLLADCEAPFRVEAGPDLSLLACFDEGPTLSARRLSGGLSVLLACCFRVASGALFAPGIRFLALDEPTQFLDSRNVGCLGPLLDRLRRLSASRGLQCFLVTHESALESQFDATIRLG